MKVTYLAHVVVCVSLQFDSDALAQPCTQALPSMPTQLDVDGVIRQPSSTEALRHLMTQRGAHCAVRVQHTKLQVAVVGTSSNSSSSSSEDS
jgi:hypothetical protein